MTNVETSLNSISEPLPEEQSVERARANIVPDRQATLGYVALQLRSEKDTAEYTLLSSNFNTQEGLRLFDMYHKAEDSLSGEIDTVRRKMTQYEGLNEAMLHRYLNSIAPFEVHGAITKRSIEKERNIDWNEWILDYATQGELLAIMSAHNDLMMQHEASDELKAEIDASLNGFIKGVSDFADNHWISDEPRDPAAVPVRYGDIFDTFLKHRAGYYHFVDKRIVLGQGYKFNRGGNIAEAKAAISPVLMHEYVHASLGSPPIPDSETWLDEGAADMISRMIRRRQGEIKGPSAYTAERKLINTLLEKVRNRNFGRQMLVRAYTNNLDNDASKLNDRASFREMINELYGSGSVIEKVSMAIEDQKNILRRNNFDERVVTSAAITIVDGKMQKDPDEILKKEYIAE